MIKLLLVEYFDTGYITMYLNCTKRKCDKCDLRFTCLTGDEIIVEAIWAYNNLRPEKGVQPARWVWKTSLLANNGEVAQDVMRLTLFPLSRPNFEKVQGYKSI